MRKLRIGGSLALTGLMGCDFHQSRESFETWGIIILATLIGAAFLINDVRRH